MDEILMNEFPVVESIFERGGQKWKNVFYRLLAAQ